jgi:uncharacterized membrane protein YdbT with pleckstrin-like domain
MDAVTQSPFAALTMIVAPAMLTNASCVLALSSINRMLRTRERMRELLAESEDEAGKSAEEIARSERQVDRVEKQAMLLMGAIASIYVALGSFALATLVSLIGAAFVSIAGQVVYRALAVIGFVLGVIGVCGLVFGCARLFRATQLSLLNIREEAETIRNRRAKRGATPR